MSAIDRYTENPKLIPTINNCHSTNQLLSIDNNNHLSRQTICLNMIVRNEAHIIASTLQNILDHMPIDYWVISDTGSTDNTINIITSFFRLRPCKEDVEELQKKIVDELNCSCVHQFVEDDIECNMEDLHINYCILCGINKI